jgi:RNA polymerase sigma-70 factor (ECF subfamily)
VSAPDASSYTNDDWLAALGGSPPQQRPALEALRAYLVRGLRAALRTRSQGNLDAMVEDYVQEALVKVLANLDSFRGQSRFTTWAQKIAVRVALSDLRRKRWDDLTLDDLNPPDAAGSDYTPPELTETNLDPFAETSQQWLLEEVSNAIEEDLTDKQREALTSLVIEGLSVEEVAEQMDTNRNALYKLLFDARKRLRAGLEQRGLPTEQILQEL